MAKSNYDEIRTIYDYLEGDPIKVLNKYRRITKEDKTLLEIWYGIEKDLMN